LPAESTPPVPTSTSSIVNLLDIFILLILTLRGYGCP
jgi:hypothetical protein